MGTWIELRCENRCEPSADGPGTMETMHLHGCWSHRNAGPMDEALDTRQSLIATVRGMEKSARASGWVRTAEGWVCPYCAEKLEDHPND